VFLGGQPRPCPKWVGHQRPPKFFEPFTCARTVSETTIKCCIDVDVDVVELRAQADASMPHLTITLITQYTLISNYYVNCDFRFREVLLGNHISYLDAAKIYQVVI